VETSSSQYNHRVFIGPAGWSYADWRNTVFSGIGGRVDALKFISSYFDAIEINSTFYRIPSRSTVESWTKRVRREGSFLFSVKLYRGFTHDPTITTYKDHHSMMEVVEVLRDKALLGAVLAQFPYRFHNTRDNRKYIAELRAKFPDIPLVVEFRHRSWLHRAVETFLRELNLGFCNIDQPQVSFSLPLTDIVTTSVGYLRCHGRNKNTWFGEKSNRDSRYFYRYRYEELRELVDTAQSIASKAEKTFVIFNNHFKGNEVFDAMEFADMLGLGNKPWPEWWLSASKLSREDETHVYEKNL
jgi:uncharacterized protein YecE (DUF72 family)